MRHYTFTARLALASTLLLFAGCSGGSGSTVTSAAVSGASLVSDSPYVGEYAGSFSGYSTANAAVSGSLTISIDNRGLVTATVNRAGYANCPATGTVDAGGHISLTATGTLPSRTDLTYVTTLTGTVAAQGSDLIADGTFATTQTGVQGNAVTGKFTAIDSSVGRSPYAGTYHITLQAAKQFSNIEDGAFDITVNLGGSVSGTMFDIATGTVTGTIGQTGIVKLYGVGNGYTDTVSGTATASEASSTIAGNFEIASNDKKTISGIATGGQTTGAITYQTNPTPGPTK